MKSFIEFINEDNSLLNGIRTLVDGGELEMALIVGEGQDLMKETIELILNKIVKDYAFGYGGWPVSIKSYIRNVEVEDFTRGEVLIVNARVNEYSVEGNWVLISHIIDSIEYWFGEKTGTAIKIVDSPIRESHEDDLDFLKNLGLDEIDKERIERRAANIIEAYNEVVGELLLQFDPKRKIFKEKMLERGLTAYSVSEIREIGDFIGDSFILSNTWNPDYELFYFDNFKRRYTIKRGELLMGSVQEDYSSKRYNRAYNPSEGAIVNIKEV